MQKNNSPSITSLSITMVLVICGLLVQESTDCLLLFIIVYCCITKSCILTFRHGPILPVSVGPLKKTTFGKLPALCQICLLLSTVATLHGILTVYLPVGWGKKDIHLDYWCSWLPCICPSGTWCLITSAMYSGLIPWGHIQRHIAPIQWRRHPWWLFFFSFSIEHCW